jgi:hypothetical protein
MFSRISRYVALPDIVATDARGRTLLSKTLRPLPQVTGTFRHTVEEADRLDHLAYKYYAQPQRWWRLADANPEFLSPQALLGKEPIVTDRFPLTFGGGQPPWAALVQDLTALPGVEDIAVVEEVHPASREHTAGGRTVTIQVDEFERAILVTYNELSTSRRDLAGAIAASGFSAASPERLDRVGGQIVIPRDVAG